MTVRAVITGIGAHLPDRVVPNDWFSGFLDTSDAWIRERTGIERRHFAADGELTSDLAIAAGRAALVDAGVDPAEVDAVIVATTTPDQTFPSTAVKTQSALGVRGFSYDIMAACAGFVFAMGNADALIRAGLARRVLVVGAETYSRILDFEDRGTCVLFGDGAGAVLLEAREGERGILGVDLNSDGSYADLLYVDGGVSMGGTSGKLRMQGREVFRHAVSKLAQTATAALEHAGLDHGDVDWVVPHQANVRIIEGTAKKLRTPMEKVIVTVQDHGNTSAASIPLALAAGRADGRLREGQIVVCEAIGGGLVWGAVAFRL
ncbi:3-oxoacyl-[acyl-carrier-protein] synthase III [Hasllibacter halocynthiae]|uniref:Beta-ketoacyl-[acyl-carrier-protein] synthase III n=1 Tax=Hasllibacter halocynthiae TaxID=595589 RepID=A0A2T0X7P1_9RHOB|nr:beta-ketoacyl-ACP synthase III [Hasllibacter halocynthiae]PRY94894.1 3-oxoacyl-[acyl-carrier-protein] synthase III [Hasllibacter halocynthiae]